MTDSRQQICLAVIPARGGSKRVVKKNIKQMCGKPLLRYTVQAAIDSGIFQNVVVSTDCEETAKVARECGAEVPFIRSADLADDHTPVSLVTLDVLEKLDPDGTRYGAVAQLMPNCPLRDAEDIRSSCRQFRETGADAQISVTRYGWLEPWWAMTRDGQYALSHLFEEQLKKRSQDLPELFCPTGAVWWAKAHALKREKTFHLEGKTGWEMPWQHAVDVDTESDWAMAELLMKAQTE